MVKARDIQEPWMDRVPDKWKQSYTSPVKIPPQLRADPEGIFEFYQKRGLIDPKYKSIVDWQNAVLKRANNAGWEVAKTLNKMNLEWLMSSRGKKLLSQNFTDKHLKQLERAMKRSSSAVGPFKFQGIPIERVRYKDKAEAIADGWKIVGNRLPFRTLQASPRAFGERIPLEMVDWFKTLEAKGTIPKGTFDKYAKWVYTVNDANKARATNFSKRVGLPKHFNKGHLAAILNNTYFGGSNDPASQVLELTLENISHGATDAISLSDMRKLDLPTNWGESAAYFMVNELGIKDNRILTGTGLPMRWSGKDMILDSDIARITRFGENADVILAETQNRIEQLAQEIEANRMKGLGDSESLKQIQSRMVDGRYVAPTITEQATKAAAAKGGGQILDVVDSTSDAVKGLSTTAKIKAALKPWLVVPVVGAGASWLGTGVQAAETIRNPTVENKARLTLNVTESLGETASAAGWLTLNPALVAGGEAVATPTGLVDLGWTGKDLKLHKWQTWRRLGVGVKDWAVDKATDDKGISSLWHNDNESREETVEIPKQSTTVLNQRKSTEDTEEELEMGVSNFN